MRRKVVIPIPTRTAAKPGARDERGLREASSVQWLYLRLRERAMRYEFLPGARINELALGREYGVSRAPLREALNRLAAEGLLEFTMNRGFTRKAISVEEVLDLYQVRSALERQAVLLVVQHASDADITSLGTYWNSVMARAELLDSGDLLLADEEFHRRLISLAGNLELSNFADIVTRRIHVARHIDLQQSDWNARAFDAHDRIVRSLAKRDTEAALLLLTEHIDMSLKRALEITKEMVARFFLVGHRSPDTGDARKPKSHRPHLDTKQKRDH